MDKQYKLFGITPSKPLQILRILVEQKFDETETRINLSSIRVLQIQATSEILKTISGPEATTRVEYLTTNGIFHADELSGVNIAEGDDDSSSIELNFITTSDDNTASLIIPTKKYLPTQAINDYYLQVLIDHFAPDRHSLEFAKEDITSFLLGVLSKMTGRDAFLDQDGSN